MSRATKARLALIVALHAGALAFDLTADPPESLDTSQGIFIDEGWKTGSARNLALFGSVQPREGLTLGWAYQSPLPTAVWRASFEALGVTRIAARLPNLLFSMGTLLLVFGIARGLGASDAAGLAAAALYAASFNATMFARLAFQETQASFWLAAALCLLIRAEARAPLGAAAAACLLGAFLSKWSAVVPALCILALSWGVDRGERRKAAWWLHGTLLLLGAAWAALWLAPHVRHILDAASTRLESDAGSSAGTALGIALVAENGYLAKVLPAFVSAWLGLLLVLLRGGTAKPGERIAAAWLASTLAMLAVASYRPGRYFPLLEPSVAVLGGLFLAWGPGALRAAWLAAGRLRKAAALALLLPGAYLVAYSALKLSPPPKGYIALASALAFALSAGLLLFLRLGPAASLQRGTQALILLLAVGFFTIQYGRWASSRTHLLAEAARAVRDAVPADATLGGYQAVALAPDLPHYVGDVDNPRGIQPTLSEKLRLVRPAYLVATRENFGALDADIQARARFLRTLTLPGPYRDSGLWIIEGSWKALR